MAIHIRIVSAALALLACGIATAGDVYQWKDAKGVTHYADAPPPKGQYDARNVSVRDGQPAATSAQAPVIDKNCALAKTNLDLLKSDRKLGVDANGDGKLDAPMSDEERARQRKLADANIQAYCSPATASSTGT